MAWTTMLAYMTGSVDEELLRRNEYLAAENRILRANILGRVTLNDGERRTLAQIGKRLGRKAVRLEFPILSLNPGLRQRCVAPDVWPMAAHRRPTAWSCKIRFTVCVSNSQFSR